MKFQRWLALLALCACATGCSRLQEAAMPVTDKINTAFPVGAETRLARERLLGLLGDDHQATEEVTRQAESLMALRALSCSKGQSIGRFDSVDMVRGRGLDLTCFQEQDKSLQAFYGVRSVGALLARPALRLLKAAGTIAVLPPGKLPHIVTGSLARDAGVGVIQDPTGKAVVVEVPGGKPIAQLAQAGTVGSAEVLVSPNGRIVASYSYSQGLVFFEAETGQRVWLPEASTTGASRLLGWLPEVQGVLMSGANGDVLLVDGRTGRIEPHPAAMKNAAFGVQIPGNPARFLLGSEREFVLLEHVRTDRGIQATATKSLTIGSGRGVTSGRLVPMQSGRMVVFASMRDIGWLDLENGASGVWQTSPRFNIPFAKLDESRLMVNEHDLSPRMSLEPWAFDVTKQTVAPIKNAESQGLIVDIGDRVGFFRRGEQAWFGDQVSTGEAQTLDGAVANYELQVQLAKLQAQVDTEQRQANLSGLGDGTGTGSPAMPAPGLADVAADAEVHMVGVYEGRQLEGGRNSAGRAVGPVRVVVRPTQRPIVLVLASYEAVSWTVMNGGARIAAVLVSGYHPSLVAGLSGVPVLRIGSNYAYEPGSQEYVRLRQAVVQYTGTRTIRSFQGRYTGSDFLVGGR